MYQEHQSSPADLAGDGTTRSRGLRGLSESHRRLPVIRGAGGKRRIRQVDGVILQCVLWQACRRLVQEMRGRGRDCASCAEVQCRAVSCSQGGEVEVHGQARARTPVLEVPLPGPLPVLLHLLLGATHARQATTQGVHLLIALVHLRVALELLPVLPHALRRGQRPLPFV